jgi:hypothetical protein
VLPDSELDRSVTALLARVSQVRGLGIKQRVKGVKLGRRAVIKRIVARAEKEIPKHALEAQGELLRAFELMPIDYDFVAGIYALIEENVAGLYDDATETMILLEDLPQDLIEQTLAHELVHALQDQHYDLTNLLRYRPGDSDRVTAIHALCEGDATSAMIDITHESAFAITPEQLRMIMAGGVALSATGGETPRVLQASLVSPYIDGFRFVQDLRRAGGWARVDAAWRRPPRTTEQLLHLDKYLADEPALAVPRPPAPTGEWVVGDSDVLGEQGLRIVLEQWTTRQAAGDAAAGWGGDRFLVVNRASEAGRDSAAAWQLTFDTEKDAREAAAAVQNAFGRRCRERRKLGPLAWERRGETLVLVAGPYRKTPGGDFVSAATCRDATRWLEQIFTNNAGATPTYRD